MEKSLKLNIILLITLFLGYNIIDNYNNFFLLIYLCLSLYHIYIFYLTLKYHWKQKYKIIIFIIISFFLYRSTYYYICDPNPVFCFVSYYIFYPNFFKAILIVLIHTFFLSRYPCGKYNNCNNDLEKKPLIEQLHFARRNNQIFPKFFFLSDLFYFITKNKIILFVFFVLLVLLSVIDVTLFINRIKLWVYFNTKEKTLPIAYSNNTLFYITAMIVNMEETINNYIEEMKKLIDYLGHKNVIVSIVENGDSKDNTRKYLKDFQNYLNKNKITNRFILKHEIDDPRKKVEPYEFLSPLRIKYYSQLRNRCLDFLYKLPNIDFDNTKILFFNDIIFKYEDIINLLATNNEDYDAVCGLDYYDCFYDTWVSIDLDGNSLKHRFPYFINKEAQDQVVNHKPVRVFSCWNGVMAFKASPLKNKKIKFRYKKNNKPPVYQINNSERNEYESECTYFHIDLFSLGYTKKFINPDVRVAYKFEDYYPRKYFYPASIEVDSYFELYSESFHEKRNKYMSNCKDTKIKLNDMVMKWYLENKRKDL